jgi:PII-like signaling protein
MKGEILDPSSLDIGIQNTQVHKNTVYRTIQQLPNLVFIADGDRAIEHVIADPE